MQATAWRFPSPVQDGCRPHFCCRATWPALSATWSGPASRIAALTGKTIFWVWRCWQPRLLERAGVWESCDGVSAWAGKVCGTLTSNVDGEHPIWILSAMAFVPSGIYARMAGAPAGRIRSQRWHLWLHGARPGGVGSMA